MPIFKIYDGTTQVELPGGGDVVGPGSATDMAIARWKAATGRLLQNSTATIADNGVMSIPGLGTGGPTDYDAIVGNPSGYGMMRIGNFRFGRTSTVIGAMNLDGTVVLSNMGGPVTGNIEFLIAESAAGTTRFALPKSGVGLATYNPRSFLNIGPAPTTSDMVDVTYWQALGFFLNLHCDTSGLGADVGVEYDLEVCHNLYVDVILESLANAGVTIEGMLLKEGNLTGAGNLVTAGAALDNLYLVVGDGGALGVKKTGVRILANTSLRGVTSFYLADDIYNNTTGLRKLAFSSGADQVNYPVLHTAASGAGIKFSAGSTVDANVNVRFAGLGAGIVKLESPTRIGDGSADDKFFFRDSAIFIHSNADGELTIEADSKVRIIRPHLSDPGDNTKQLTVDVSAITTATVRTLTYPDADVTLRIDKLNATVAPTVNDDADDGYSVGSFWGDVTGDWGYVCLDATVGAAVWRHIGSSPVLQSGPVYVEHSSNQASGGVFTSSGGDKFEMGVGFEPNFSGTVYLHASFLLPRVIPAFMKPRLTFWVATKSTAGTFSVDPDFSDWGGGDVDSSGWTSGTNTGFILSTEDTATSYIAQLPAGILPLTARNRLRVRLQCSNNGLMNAEVYILTPLQLEWDKN